MGLIKTNLDRLAGLARGLVQLSKLNHKFLAIIGSSRKLELTRFKKIRTRFALKMKAPRSIKNLIIFGAIFICALIIWKVSDTNSYFSDKVESKDNTFTAGYWIPELKGSYAPADPDGKDNWYITAPCVTLSAKIGDSHSDSTIYYEFSDDGDPVSGGHKYNGACVTVPDGEIDFQAQAVNDDNPDDWRSEIISYQFKADTTAPSVPDWDKPEDGAYTHQDEKIKISWEASGDAASGVAGYLYEVSEPEDGTSFHDKYSACGLINRAHVPTGQSCFSGDDVELSRGEGVYERKVRAVDKAGNMSAWSDIAKIKLDKIPPVTKVDSVAQDDEDPAVVKIEYNAGDNLAGVKSVRLFYRKNGGAWQEYQEDEDGFTSSPIEFDTSASDLGEGDYEFYTLGEDKADDLSGSEMTSGNGDNGKGNLEVRDPQAEGNIHIEFSSEGPPEDPGEPPVPG